MKDLWWEVLSAVETDCWWENDWELWMVPLSEGQSVTQSVVQLETRMAALLDCLMGCVMGLDWKLSMELLKVPMSDQQLALRRAKLSVCDSESLTALVWARLMGWMMEPVKECRMVPRLVLALVKCLA